MRRRMALSMTLLVLLLLSAGTGLVAWRSFSMMTDRERERALGEEAAIARAVALELGVQDGETVYSVAQGIQGRYGSESLRVMLLRYGAPLEGVRIEGEDAVFFAERDLTIELLRNLVVNAQRAGGNAPVVVTMRKDGFDVSDRGRGMTQEEAARAFEPFYKADKARMRGAGGAGLGLTICSRIAQLHGGTLTIESAPGQGTTVIYRFVTSP